MSRSWLPYARQVLELEKIARLEGLEPHAPLEATPLAPREAGQDARCVVCEAAPATCCAACLGVAYCSEQHRDVDAVWHHAACGVLRDIAQDAAVLRRRSPRELVAGWLDRPQRERALPVDWDAYFGERADDPAQRRVLSDLASRPLTLARLLQQLELVRGGDVDRRLRIHVMAASEKELEAPAIYAELATFWPKLRIELSFIGPELSGVAKQGQVSGVALQLLAAEYRRALWSKLGVPDLIVGFDAGLLLYRSWQATVLDLIQGGAPFAITSYRAWEAHAEARLLSGSGATCLQPPTKNPFASLAARRSTTLVNDVSRDNDFVSVWC